MSSVQIYHAQGKLLLSSEYFILNGAVGLAFPTRYGQQLQVTDTPGSGAIHWQSYDHQGQIWFEGQFSIHDFQPINNSDAATAARLTQILEALFLLRGKDTFLQRPLLLQTYLEFPRNWGLGSSSTLLASLAEWAAVNPYDLLERTFGGSGYDLACAISTQPLLYQRRSGRGHAVTVPFAPPFREKLHFVYLNRKQNSREGIRRFREKVQPSTEDNEQLSRISIDLLRAKDLMSFQALLDRHEDFIAGKLGLPKVRDLYFSDFPGSIKSLGAWGGDFVLVASVEPADAVRAYFADKGMATVLSFGEMVL